MTLIIEKNKILSLILHHNAIQLSTPGDKRETKFLANRQRISVSGMQEKLSLLLDGNRLRLTEAGERGQYLLKPIPRDLKQAADVPANEHLTMQIAT